MNSLLQAPARALACALCLLSLPALAAAQAGEPELTQMSLEDLMKIEVTSVSRKSQRLTDTAAAAFVLTADDIARSGATSLPAALRLVPGLDVARLSSSHWAVSARGFNGRFANKLLVLIDGRSIYSPLFSGVFWESEDVMLEDIDRIEVIRGPGASLWGANAVNGVINIITRKARATQGSLVAAAAGNDDRAMLALRHGGTLAEDSWYRVWAKTHEVAPAETADGRSGDDRTRAWRTGLRIDREASHGGRFTLVGNASRMTTGQGLLSPITTAPYMVPTRVRQMSEGANLLGRYEWTLGGGAQATVQGYVDATRIDANFADERRKTADIDFQVRQLMGERHDVIWGLGLRHSRDDVRTNGNGYLRIDPQKGDFTLASAFVHDDIELVPSLWRLVLGSRLEHNSYTDFEFQPNARVVFTPNVTNTLWGAVSRAARMPSRAEQNVEITLNTTPPNTAANPSPLPVLQTVVPNPGYQSERVTAWELGWRTQLANELSIDIAAFSNDYSRLRTSRTVSQNMAFDPNGVPYIDYRIITDTSMSARSKGVEVAADWHPASWWRLQAACTWFSIRAQRNGDPAHDASAAMAEGISPRHQVSLRSSVNLGADHQVDAWLRHVGRLDYMAIPAYTTLDLRYAWRVTRRVELSIVGQNLTDPSHPEFVSDHLPTPALEVGRAAYVKLRWQF